MPPKRSDSARMHVCGVLSMPQATSQLSLFLIPSEFQQISAAVTPTLHGACIFVLAPLIHYYLNKFESNWNISIS